MTASLMKHLAAIALVGAIASPVFASPASAQHAAVAARAKVESTSTLAYCDPGRVRHIARCDPGRVRNLA